MSAEISNSSIDVHSVVVEKAVSTTQYVIPTTQLQHIGSNTFYTMTFELTCHSSTTDRIR